MGILNWLGLTSDCEADPVALDDANFVKEVRRSPIPVMVDAWSAGCMPCVQLAPTVKRMACKWEGQLKVAHLNVGTAQKTAAKLGIRGTPTVLFFNEGNVVERVVGIRGQHYYEEIVSEMLGHDFAPTEDT